VFFNFFLILSAKNAIKGQRRRQGPLNMYTFIVKCYNVSIHTIWA